MSGIFLQFAFNIARGNKHLMSDEVFWREHVELPKGWMTRLSSKSNPETGVRSRYYRAPDGTMFRSEDCMLKFLEGQGRLDEYHCLLFFSFSFLLLSLSLVLCVLCPSFFVCLSQLLLFLFCFLETRSSLQSFHSLLPCIFFSHLFCKHSPLPATTKML